MPVSQDGDSNEQFYARVYQQLRAIAKAKLANERSNHTLQATALVNEAYLKLQQHPSISAKERAHFFHAASEAMRQILIDHARSKGRQKRGGKGIRTISDVAELAADSPAENILALEEAICRLEQIEPRSATVIKLRFFAGLSVEETAEATKLSVRTVIREWNYARAWLYKALE